MTEGKPQDTPSDREPCFEEALEALERIVHDLEEGRIGLAESLSRYEEGVKLIKQCHSLLEHAERKIELLTGVDASGNPISEPFDDEATHSATESAAPRSRRGGKTSKKPASTLPGSSASAPPAIDEPGSLF